MKQSLDSSLRRIAWLALLMEAALYLLVARIAIQVVPFRRLTWFFERPTRQPELVGSEREQARYTIRRALWFVAPRLPGKIVCFPKAIAAQAMLRRRRVSSVLYYGVKTGPDKGLEAHVWVKDGEHPIVGILSSQEFTVLSSYPNSH